MQRLHDASALHRVVQARRSVYFSPRPDYEALNAARGLCRFLDDRRIEIDNNVVERTIRPLGLTRKNALFAGSDGGAGH